MTEQKAKDTPDQKEELTEDELEAVNGGSGEPVARKAGKGQQEFLVVKLNDVIIT